MKSSYKDKKIAAEEKSSLFPGIPDDTKRVGILRTFHHKMYEEDESKSKKEKKLCSTFCEYYFHDNKNYCFLVLVSLAMILVGILSLVYGLILPRLYETLENSDTSFKSLEEDKAQAEKERGIFLYASVAIISSGFILAAFGFFMPLYKDSGESSDADSIVKAPILVDYEIAPYYTKDPSELNSVHNYAFEDQSSEWTTSPCESPTDNVSFKTFLVQQDSHLRDR